MDNNNSEISLFKETIAVINDNSTIDNINRGLLRLLICIVISEIHLIIYIYFGSIYRENAQ